MNDRTTFLLLVVFLLAKVKTIHIGNIRNASYSANCSFLTMNASTCSECLCTMVSPQGNLSVLSLNCRVLTVNHVHCQLFTNATYTNSCLQQLQNVSNSTFYFQELPPSIPMTTKIAVVCNASCINQTSSSTSTLMASWSLDGTLHDQRNAYNLSSTNGPVFSDNAISGHSVFFNASANQSLTTSYMPLTNTSFTISAWIHPMTFRNRHNSIFGVCGNRSVSSCLHTTVRNWTTNFTLIFSFWGAGDCLGNTTISLNRWVHTAFVFDLTILTKFIYVNGQLDAQCPTSPLFIAMRGSSSLGHIRDLSSDANYFQGYIDELAVDRRVYSACEILEQATLVARFAFDNGSFLVDSGPSTLSAVAISCSTLASDHSREAIFFLGSPMSYFQASGISFFNSIFKAFSISFWIQPSSLTGVLIHFSSMSNSSSGWCSSFLGFHSNGSLVARIPSNETIEVIAPTALPLSPAWSHIVQTWSQTRGLQLFVNTVLVASLPSAGQWNGSIPSSVYMTVPMTLPVTTSCLSGSLPKNRSFAGAIDNLIVYRRELSANDICHLYAT